MKALLKDQLVDVSSSSENGLFQPVFTSAAGSCGGEALFERVDENRVENVYGEISFTDYCHEGISLSGKVSIYKPENSDTDEVRASFCNLIFSTPGDSFTATGAVDMIPVDTNSTK